MGVGARCGSKALSSSMVEEGLPSETKLWIYRYYGTPSRAYWSVFELTFSGGWPAYARTLVEDVSGWYALFFAVYIGGVVFAMFRIITALFLKDTLTVASSDMEAIRAFGALHSVFGAFARVV